MTTMYDPDTGKAVVVTVLKYQPTFVTDVKTPERDGYSAIQLGVKAGSKVTKPIKGKVAKSGIKADLNSFRELRLDTPGEMKPGDEIKLSELNPGDELTIVGRTKGKGFAGVVKRHSFRGAPATHGHKHDNRIGGSIGSVDAARVFKGRKMAGRMGNEMQTLKKIKIEKVDVEAGEVWVNSSIPGPKNAMIFAYAK